MLNRADKIALGYVGIVGALAVTAVGWVLKEQDKEISRLKKRNRMLHETLDLIVKLNAGENVQEEVIDHIVKYTDMPNYITDIPKKDS